VSAGVIAHTLWTSAAPAMVYRLYADEWHLNHTVTTGPAFGIYGATKAAVRNLVRIWTMELKDRRIRSNVLSPGPIKTPLVDLQPPDAIARILATIPMGCMGEPDEVAKAAVFLASDDSSFVTGIELFVDGGRGQV
jgi:NAD(P)-dependent dehydrogenase (short-subunit alcohol dehydrogenase family)